MAQRHRDIRMLNHLIGHTMDSAENYRKAMGDVRSSDLTLRFRIRCRERLATIALLREQVDAIGGDPKDDGTDLEKVAYQPATGAARWRLDRGTGSGPGGRKSEKKIRCGAGRPSAFTALPRSGAARLRIRARRAGGAGGTQTGLPKGIALSVCSPSLERRRFRYYSSCFVGDL
jgi:hypothetical protein